MNNDWLQITRVSGDIELYNTDEILYLAKGTARRVLMKRLPQIILGVGDTTQSKTQLEVETFLGGSFVKVDKGDMDILIPVKSLEYITKIEELVEVRIKGLVDMETITMFDDIETEF